MGNRMKTKLLFGYLWENIKRERIYSLWCSFLKGHCWSQQFSSCSLCQGHLLQQHGRGMLVISLTLKYLTWAIFLTSDVPAWSCLVYLMMMRQHSSYPGYWGLLIMTLSKQDFLTVSLLSLISVTLVPKWAFQKNWTQTFIDLSHHF